MVSALYGHGVTLIYDRASHKTNTADKTIHDIDHINEKSNDIC